MRVIITNSYDEMSKEAAKIVAGQIYLKPDSVLGLATGSTPLQMYKKLIAVHEMVGLDFSQSRHSTSTNTSACLRTIRRAIIIS